MNNLRWMVKCRENLLKAQLTELMHQLSKRAIELEEQKLGVCMWKSFKSIYSPHQLLRCSVKIAENKVHFRVPSSPDSYLICTRMISLMISPVELFWEMKREYQPKGDGSWISILCSIRRKFYCTLTHFLSIKENVKYRQWLRFAWFEILDANNSSTRPSPFPI